MKQPATVEISLLLQTKVTKTCYHQMRFLVSQCHSLQKYVDGRSFTPDSTGGTYSAP